MIPALSLLPANDLILCVIMAGPQCPDIWSNILGISVRVFWINGPPALISSVEGLNKTKSGPPLSKRILLPDR